MPSLFKPDRKGIAEILKTQFHEQTHALAEQIADEVRSQHPDADIVVDDYVTDRAASSVTIRDAAGKLWQVRDGVLTRAAAGVGLEVTERVR
jgi:hypothetical protein